MCFFSLFNSVMENNGRICLMNYPAFLPLIANKPSLKIVATESATAVH